MEHTALIVVIYNHAPASEYNEKVDDANAHGEAPLSMHRSASGSTCPNALLKNFLPLKFQQRKGNEGMTYQRAVEDNMVTVYNVIQYSNKVAREPIGEGRWVG